MTPFKINTSKNGSFRVSDTSIAHYLQNTKEVSKGFLVRNHFTAVQRALFTAYFLADGKCFESIAGRGFDPKEAPKLNDILDTMEWQINSFTNGKYKEFAESYDAHRTITAYHYWHEIQNIFLSIKSLRDGRYYEKLHYRSVPRIEVTGGNLVDCIMDLVWRLDNEDDSNQAEVDEAMMKYNKLFS